MSVSRTQVVLIGVSGCSASGKSLVSSRLAAMLGSPLFPVAMDSFFDEDECERLGVWEDPRCLRAAEYTQCVATIRALIEQYGVAAAPLHTVKDAAQFLRFEASSAVSHPPMRESAVSYTVKSYGEASKKCVSEANNIVLSSLCMNDACVAGNAADGTDVALEKVFIVCEGFLIFGYPELCNMFDFFVFVHSDNETACLRRFFRGSRRKKRKPQGGNCDRILRMRTSRVNAELWSSEGAAANKTLSPSFSSVLPHLKYMPPQPSSPNDYQGFWLQSEYKELPPPMPFGMSGLKAPPYDWLEVKDLPYVKQMLHQWANASCVDDVEGVLGRYFEFRYWFYYEVLFYHYQLRGISEENVTTACQAKGTTKTSPSQSVLHIKNDASVSCVMLDSQLSALARQVSGDLINGEGEVRLLLG
ncbi:hypothetical protein, conserved [Trypanosoma brucei gambiense DAL972]|uniref:Phosphoribulokinase/uridine kinase domain-containing protein n=1 Tax=Trypanosoma brucei gambiense (strain MHOM/CI/86/DAL972) TaxID=679716 RepID=C9ZPQ7_TRYB9|nr:hypothetical protein, conserved [Trypanosoma brucei gambiense DAL972]CBH11385.1 hypothetical protein, conserved [Trypanosoma brucei gambiense DAL972]|eukprot:XP_011773672.1 hypothetical protein, conserved [Trypanosoma brucei gambiense DAL972]